MNKMTMRDGYRYIGRQIRNKWDEHGSLACTIAGTTGLFLSGIYACRKTYKIHNELEENGRKISEARKARDGDKRGSKAWRTVKETAKCCLKTSRHYIGPAIAGGVSGFAIQKGWQIENNHYQQAVAMGAVVMADFMNYRRNVIAEHGTEADRRYMTTKRGKAVSISQDKGEKVAASSDENGHVVELGENSLRILYSKDTTPMVWSESHVIRMHHLEGIVNNLNIDLMYGGSYSVNDVRRYFYGRRGDIPEGNLFGRIWDPGNPEHPERGAKVNLHYEEDEDFMLGLKDWCWIIVDIDPEPLFELQKGKKDRDVGRSLIGV